MWPVHTSPESYGLLGVAILLFLVLRMLYVTYDSFYRRNGGIKKMLADTGGWLAQALLFTLWVCVILFVGMCAAYWLANQD